MDLTLHTGLYCEAVSVCDTPDVMRRPGAQLSSRVERYVRRSFGRDADRAVALLNETVPGLPLSRGQDPERLAVALALVADGDYRRLEEAARAASVDWRGVVAASGLGDDDWRRSLNEVLGESSDRLEPFTSKAEAGAGAFLVGWTLIPIGLVGMWFVYWLFFVFVAGFLLLLVRSRRKYAEGRAGPWYVGRMMPFNERHLFRNYKLAWRMVTNQAS
jgi:hypothetical protein